ncbi:MAG: hypothetical protein V9G17_04660 [Nitrospira sp.]|nr:hypothetical protein [Nitrospira sp.]HQY59316.1 hypothetical protein [Nitrospira sp.]HRA97808.1 hypothetical protein [Nitrospira sp.]
MAKGNNLTYLFKGDSETANALPHCSESFWTAVLGLLFFHLGAQKERAGALNVYQCLPDAKKEPWYESRKPNSHIHLDGVCRNDLCIEPTRLTDYYGADATMGGIRPDIVVRLPPTECGGFSTHLILECKTVGARAENVQLEKYVKFSDHLQANGHRTEVLLVIPISCHTNIYNAAKLAQLKYSNRFGLLLWEDLFRRMVETNFILPGFDFKKIVDDGYTDVLDTEVAKDGSL